MTHVRDFVRHWAPALIGAGVVAIILVVALTVGLVRNSQHDAGQDRRDAAVRACMWREMNNIQPDQTATDIIVGCSLKAG